LPNIPDDLLQFFRRCDGLNANLQDEVEGQLYSIMEATSIFPIAEHPDVARRFFPISGDGCGDYECVVVGNGIAEGALVFWDHELPEGAAYLMAGSFGSFFEMWADHLITRYFPDGTEDPRYIAPALTKWPWIGEPELTHPWPFDEKWITARDRRAADLLARKETRAWFVKRS
jgi:hypothetical protein